MRFVHYSCFVSKFIFLFLRQFLAESFQDGATEEENGDCKYDNNADVDAEMVFEAVTRGLRRGCRRFGITVNQILCALTWRPDWAMPTLDMAQKYRDDFPCATVGVDVASGEEHFNKEQHPDLYQPHYDMIQRAKREGMPITLHAGESTDQALDNVRRAVAEYGASRIGHGYRVVKSPQLMKELKKQNIHVEVCPTSSLETGGWIIEGDERNKNWKDHPCVAMKENGLSFSLSSDDPAVFHTSLAWQYRIFLAKMGLSREAVLEANLHAIDAAFCPDADKERLRAAVRGYGSFKRLRSDLSEHNAHASGNHRHLDLRRTMSETFADRVYISRSQYF